MGAREEWLKMMQSGAGYPQMPNVYAQQSQSLQSMPEWAGGKNGQYMAPDIGSQASQLNFQQDLMGTGMDPFAAFLAGPGSYDESMFSPTYEVVPGESGGATYLNNILQSSDPNSAEYLIADYVSNGGSPMEAVQLLQQKGIVPAPQYIDDPAAPGTGKKVLDPAASQTLDYYTKFATDAYSKRLSDTPDTEKEIPNENLKAITDAGYTDPRQQYTTDFVDPSLQSGRDDLGAKRAMIQGMVGQRSGLDAQQASLTGDRSGIMAGAVDALMGRPAGPSQDAGSQRAQSRVNREPMRDNSAQRNELTSGIKSAFVGLDKGMHGQMLNQAKARAVALHLQRQGRTPFLDQNQARMTAMMNRGVGS